MNPVIAQGPNAITTEPPKRSSRSTVIPAPRRRRTTTSRIFTRRRIDDLGRSLRLEETFASSSVGGPGKMSTGRSKAILTAVSKQP